MSSKALSEALSVAAKSSASTKGGGSGRPAPSAGNKKAPGLFSRLDALYRRMEAAYSLCASEAGLTCDGCAENCCTSFFQHHTYVEWAFLWRGLQSLPEARLQAIRLRADEYVAQARERLAAGALPTAMCPLNHEGLCSLYSHRLMICRLHGTRNTFTLPDGRQQIFPGCGRFAGLPCSVASPIEGEASNCPSLDRTPFYKELAALEMEFLRKAWQRMPRVDITIAEMIVRGPTRLQ